MDLSSFPVDVYYKLIIMGALEKLVKVLILENVWGHMHPYKTPASPLASTHI